MRECMSQGLQPDTIAFNSLVSACDKGLDPVQAQAAFDLMPSRGLAADAISYACLVSAYASVGDAEAAAAVWRGMPAGREVVVPTTPEGSNASSAGVFETKELFDELLRSCQVACLAARAVLFYPVVLCCCSMRAMVLCARHGPRALQGSARASHAAHDMRLLAHHMRHITSHARYLRPGHACSRVTHLCTRVRAFVPGTGSGGSGHGILAGDGIAWFQANRLHLWAHGCGETSAARPSLA